MTDDTQTNAEPRFIGAQTFHDAGGVDDWRGLFWGAHAHYVTDSFADAVRLVDAIAEVVAEVGHEPDLDVRPHGVTIRTCSRPDGALSRKDVELAQAISRVARELGYTADPAQLVIVGIAVAQEPGKDVRPFWTAALGYDPLGPEDALDPQRRGPHLWFHDIDPPRPGRGRTHIDVSVPADQAQARVDAALAAGGRLVRSNAPESWTIASPDNHGIDIAAWPDFYGDDFIDQ